MAAVSETIVREYFELNGFLVRQHRKFTSPTRHENDEIDFLVFNPKASNTLPPLPFELTSRDLLDISKAVVVVKGWHTETFSPAVLANAPEIFRSLGPDALKRAAEGFTNDQSLVRILVIPALPHGDEARFQSIELLKSKGIDAVIPFRTILSNLIERTQTNRNYQKSDVLQLIRVLKNYDFFTEPQMELFKPRSKKSGQGRGA